MYMTYKRTQITPMKLFTLGVHHADKEVILSKQYIFFFFQVSSSKIIKHVILTYMHLFPILKH